MEKGGQELEEALAAAEPRDPASVRRFYEVLLESELYLPEESVVLGDPELPILPAFSSEAIGRAWLGDDSAKLIPRSFRSLVLGATTGIHLNPGAEIGKELTLWELGKLAQGRDAIEELVFDQCEIGSETHLERRALPNELRELLVRQRPTFEAYELLDEVRGALVGHDETELILIGVCGREGANAFLSAIASELSVLIPLGLRVIDLGNSSGFDPLHELVREGEILFVRTQSS